MPLLQAAITSGERAWFQAVFVDPWPFWAGGLAIGAFVVVFLVLTRRTFGVSTGFEDACAAWSDPEARRSWRLPLFAGLVAGGLLSSLLAGGPAPGWAMGAFDVLVGDSLVLKALVFTAGGVLLGFGARFAGGCTSGHSIVGVSVLAPSSLVATGAFLAAGFAVTNLLVRSLGG